MASKISKIPLARLEFSCYIVADAKEGYVWTESIPPPPELLDTELSIPESRTFRAESDRPAEVAIRVPGSPFCHVYFQGYERAIIDFNTIVVFVDGCWPKPGTPRAGVGVYFNRRSAYNVSMHAPAREPQTKQFAELNAAIIALKNIQTALAHEHEYYNQFCDWIVIGSCSYYLKQLVMEPIDTRRDNRWSENRQSEAAQRRVNELYSLMQEIEDHGRTLKWWWIAKEDNPATDMAKEACKA